MIRYRYSHSVIYFRFVLPAYFFAFPSANGAVPASPHRGPSAEVCQPERNGGGGEKERGAAGPWVSLFDQWLFQISDTLEVPTRRPRGICPKNMALVHFRIL